ncbi:protein HYPER-SENSITIVITY-RELATED 4-like [Rhodamnia argentea]|uniref:Protein HYPER-SENSITIVITY-RELATED 4-like n=1 Tax=Rhodamnia argentea TaxID=178133 RepID=A0A8B8NKA5_9MYRT|nr:protein HYPER-SENSITIVITY-RELATED 4-like [Rhodamnia argentea]
MFSDANMPSAKTIVSTAASIAASTMVVRSLLRDLVPYELQYYLFRSIQGFFKSFSSEVSVVIEEFDGLAGNQIYKAAELYLGSKISPTTQSYRVCLPVKGTKMCVFMAKNQEVTDVFKGVNFKWRQITREVELKQMTHEGRQSQLSEVRYYQLKFHKKHKDLVFNSYFPFILKEGYNVQEARKTLKLYTLQSDYFRGYPCMEDSWLSVNLHHPSTFDTLAMDSDLKKKIMEDLDRFVTRKDYYGRVGKAWKRGYLLYGPPGTGKSSLVAAMANYLNFSIYDLELTNISHNSQLRKVLLATEDKSILVEDIDCSLDLKDQQAENETPAPIGKRPSPRQTQVTLSGLLNFIDGLWSSCGDARIIVFTTNHKEKLDPALLRPGRMDMHIHMSYCTPYGFKTLAANYLSTTDHPLFPEIEELMKSAFVTPAEVGEQLLKIDDPDMALQGLLGFLYTNRRENSQ